MAERTGKCTNYTTCTLAYRNQPITVTGDLVCPECGKPLQELKPKTVPGPPLFKQKWFLYGAPAVLLLIFIGILATPSDVKPPHKSEPAATPEPAPAPLATPVPIATPPPVADDKPPATPVPLPSEPAEPAGPVVAPAKIETDPGTRENSAIKQEVLKRVDQVPSLTDRERDAMARQVERARAMGKIITVPFEAGKTTLAPKSVAELQAVLKSPEVAAFTGDATVVFVVLGFADKCGDPKKNITVSQDRAENVVRTLREKCGVQSLMHSVGMGSSELFEQGDLARNRVAEIWAVLP